MTGKSGWTRREAIAAMGAAGAMVTGGLLWGSVYADSSNGKGVPGKGKNKQPDQVQPQEAILNVQTFGATGDGITDDTAAFLEALSVGGAIYIPATSAHYVLTQTLLLPTGAQLISNGAELRWTTAGIGGLLVQDVERVRVDGLIVTGLGAQDGQAPGENLVVCKDSSDLVFRNVVIQHCRSQAALQLLHCTNVHVTQCSIQQFTYAGIQVLGQSSDIQITHCCIEDCQGRFAHKGVSYGIHISVGTKQGLSYYPVRVTVAYNAVRRIPNWDGINAHGGEQLDILYNVIEDVRNSIELNLYYVQAGNILKSIRVIGNTCIGTMETVVNHNLASGISVAGAEQLRAEEVWICDNVVRLTNAHQSGTGINGGIRVHRARNCTITNNVIEDSRSCYGIRMLGELQSFRISGNQVRSFDGVGIYAGYGSVSNGLITDNIVVHDDPAYTPTEAFAAGSTGTTNVIERDNLVVGVSRYSIYAAAQMRLQQQYGEKSPQEYGDRQTVWDKGAIVRNSTPSIGGPAGWICVASGSPGTWASFGTLTAVTN